MAFESGLMAESGGKKMADSFDSANPFIWILGFVLIFWVIGGWGTNGRGSVAADVAVAESVNTNGFWRDNFNALAALGNQANTNANGLAQLILTQNQGISQKIDDNEYRSLERENANLRQELQTATILNGVNGRFCAIEKQLERKPNYPEFNICGSWETGCGGCC